MANIEENCSLISHSGSRREADGVAEDLTEQAWREEFERLGELLVYDNVKQGAIYNDERKRQAAILWLGQEARNRRAREAQSSWYSRWTFYAALGAILVGIAGIVVTFKH